MHFRKELMAIWIVWRPLGRGPIANKVGEPEGSREWSTPVCGQLFSGSNELGEHRAGFCSGRNTAQDTWTPSSKVDLINAWLGGGILGDCND
jgi:hypothetical protein